MTFNDAFPPPLDERRKKSLSIRLTLLRKPTQLASFSSAPGGCAPRVCFLSGAFYFSLAFQSEELSSHRGEHLPIKRHVTWPDSSPTSLVDLIYEPLDHNGISCDHQSSEQLHNFPLLLCLPSFLWAVFCLRCATLRIASELNYIKRNLIIGSREALLTGHNQRRRD